MPTGKAKLEPSIKCSRDTIPVDASPRWINQKTKSILQPKNSVAFIQVPKSTMGANQQRNCLEAAKLAIKIVPGYTAQNKQALIQLYEEEDLKRDGLQNTLDELCI